MLGLRGAPVSLQSPLCSPPSLRPLSPLPQFRRPSMTQFGPSERARGAVERQECFEGWDIPHCSFTQALCNSGWRSRDVALQQPWEAKVLSPPQWLPSCNLIMQASCIHNNLQTDGWTDRKKRKTEETWKRQARQLETERQLETARDS